MPGRESEKLHIVLADDHVLVREGIKMLLEKLAGDIRVSEAGTLDETLAYETAVDLVILDLGMPGMDGMAGLEAARRHFGKVPVVVISGSTPRQDVMGALERGAAGYIPKTLSGDAMLKALELVISGEPYLPSLLLQPEGGEATGLGAAEFSALTAREREVLELLTEGLSNRQIAERLAVQEITIKAHLQPVYRKLGVANRTQAVTLALSAGIGR